MAPETRSRGVPAPSRVYHSTPALQQVHFPARRRLARTNGRRDRKGEASKDTGSASDRAVRDRRLRQQTLTQIDFVSSLEEEDEPVTLSGSEKEDFGAENKENQRPLEGKTEDNFEPTASAETDNDNHKDNDEPALGSERKRQRRNASKTANMNERNKRRRTQGDSSAASRLTNQERKARRRTAGDAPTSSYHTQTLTQFMGGRDDHYHQLELIADSADEDEDFDDWLQTEPRSPSPRGTGRGRTQRPQRAARQVLSQDDGGDDDDAGTAVDAPGRADKEAEASRQTSVVPQTPAKRTTRTEIPSSSQQTTPFNSTMLDRYGPPDKPHESPTARRFQPAAETKQLVDLPGKPRAVSVPRKRAMLVVEDSFATTDSWGTAGDASNVTPLRSQRGFNSQASSPRSPLLDDTPSKSRRRTNDELGKTESTMLEKPSAPSKKATQYVVEQAPHQPSRNLALEIPDSEDEEDDFMDEEEAEENQEVQLEEQFEEPQDKQVEEQSDQQQQECDEGATFDAGPETQLLLGEVASSVSQNSKHVSSKVTPPDLASAPTRANSGQIPKPVNPVSASQPSSPQLPRHPSPLQSFTRTKPLRKPIPRSLIRSSQPTQPLESQRVPLATIQGLGAPAFGTDLLLPVAPATLRPLVSGHQIHLSLPFKAPGSVVRLWLFDGVWLQYMACAADSHDTKGAAGAWQHGISQVYELNNPLEEQDMRDEGWLEGDIGRYRNIPPAVAAQLLANLRHALFRDDDETTPGDDDDDEYTKHEAEKGRPQPPPQPSRRRAEDAASKRKPSSTPAGSSFSISQQVEAQLRSDIANSTTNGPLSEDVLVPSTPEAHRTTVSCSTPTPTSTVAAATATTKVSSNKTTLPPPPLPPPRRSQPSAARTTAPTAIQPSQATTASQVSNLEISQPQKQQQQQQLSSSARCSPPHTQSSSSHLTFQDYGSSPAFAYGYNHSNTSSTRLPSSQLLTKSQMLPDSLIRDDPRMPSQTWDSDDDR